MTDVDEFGPDAIPATGFGPGGYGAGAIAPVMLPNRGAPQHYNDTSNERPARRAKRGHVGVQLRNGVANFARGILAPPRATAPAANVNKAVRIGDKAVIPPSPAQINAWAAMTAGAQPQEVTGNGSVVAGMPWGGGVY